MIRVFVTGTDTGVGKTHVTALLARLARADGRSVVACKPVASGVDDGPGDDALALAAAAGHAPCVFATFRAPVSPHRAALLEGRSAPTDLAERIAALSADVVLVEGVGGWRVPLSLDPPRFVDELARATGPDVVVVAADRLGVLNHTLLTVESVRGAGFRVSAVVLNATSPGPGDLSVHYNADDLRALTGAPVIRVPFFGDDPQAEAAAADLRRVILPPTELS